MIPVQPQPCPHAFDKLVRVPGQSYYQKTGKVNEPFWRSCKNDLWQLYLKRCAYTTLLLRLNQASVEHFKPKSLFPQLAYEWSNYRLVLEQANWDRDCHEILDPFKIQHDWLVLDFETFYIFSGDDLPSEFQTLAETTCNEILNKQYLLDRRRGFWSEYLRNIQFYPEAFLDLETASPFVAYEAERQGLLHA